MKKALINLLPAIFLTIPFAAHAYLAVSVNIAPPPLPVYVQPPIPGDGYMWVPGYWAWNPDVSDYYWVPGTWVPAPYAGALWTPGYWGWVGGNYLWHQGYWGDHVGFYGGVNYGFGYIGTGYVGGRWDHGAFAYNSAVNNVNVRNVHITNVYRTNVVNNTNIRRVSFNGGNGGIQAHPTAQQTAFARAAHTQPTPMQMQHEQAAHDNTQLRASVNHGKPAITSPAPGKFATTPDIAGRGTPAPMNNPPSGANHQIPQQHQQLQNRPQAPTQPAPQQHPVTPQPQPRPQPQFHPQPSQPPQQHQEPHPQPNQEPHAQPPRPQQSGGQQHHEEERR